MRGRDPTRRAVLALGCGVLGLASLGGCGPDRLEEAVNADLDAWQRGTGRVRGTRGADALILSDGITLVLAGYRAPRGPSGQSAGEPGHAEARARLEALTVGLPIAWRSGQPDRWGRVRAVVSLVEGSADEPLAGSLQDTLLREGWGRVDPEPASRRDAPAFLAAEAFARTNTLGLWAEPYYAVRSPQAVVAGVGAFQIVEGQVVDAALAGARRFLNFGADYRSDFTAGLERAHASVVLAGLGGEVSGDLDLTWASLAGRQVRVRGFVESWNGPYVALYEAAQLEVL